MRTATLVLAATITLALAQLRPAGAAGPVCTTATSACTEWVTIGKGPARSLIYRTRSLDARNDGVRRALIMVHGTNRNADHYFTTAATAAFLAGALDDSVVISPRIASSAGSCKDTLAEERSQLELHGRQLAIRRSGGQSS